MAPTTRRSKIGDLTSVPIPEGTQQNLPHNVEQVPDTACSNPLIPALLAVFGVSDVKDLPRCTIATGRQRKEFCMVCQCNINKGGKKSDSPRRHILKYHYQKPLFSCSVCGHSSQYDKGKVNIHIRRKHKGVGEAVATPKDEYIQDLQEWMERCFPKEDLSCRESLSPNGLTELESNGMEQMGDESLDNKSALKSLSNNATLPQFHEVKEEPVDPAYEKSLSPLSLSRRRQLPPVQRSPPPNGRDTVRTSCRDDQLPLPHSAVIM